MEFELAEWSSKIEVGLPMIDEQHRQLFDLAATFRGAGDQIRVLKSLAMLTEYVKVHFREEEELMASCHYPDLEAHRRLHGEFRRMLFELLENAKQMTLDEITGGSPYGATTIAGGQGQRQPSANELDGARFQGKLIAETANKLFAA